MGRFWIIVGMGLVLVALLGLALRWLRRQRHQKATPAKKALKVTVVAACMTILWLLVGGLELLWHERRDQPVTVEDLRIWAPIRSRI